MPVLVTGAESSAGHAVVRALQRAGGEVRVFLDADRSRDQEATALRRIGCKVALGTMDDEAHLETALEQVHTIVHLAGGPLREPREALDALATVTSAAIGAGCRRLIWPVELAVADPGDNVYLGAQAEGLALVDGLPMETVILRCGLRYGPDDPLTATLADGVPPGADPAARHAPLFVDDVAEAVALADRQRGSTLDLRISVELVGPQEVALGDFTARLPRQSTEAVELPAWVADWLSRDAVGGPNALGRQGTSLEEGMQRLPP